MKKPVSICFVDDDQREVDRFRDCLGHRYTIGADTTLEGALEELRKQGVRRPDVVLLDLYYGPILDDPGKRKALEDADEELTRMELRLQQLLNDSGQSPTGGFKLAQVVSKKFPSIPLAFFSRKAFLRDALRAGEMGLMVLEKPDPTESDLIKPDPYKSALEGSADEIARRINEMVFLNTWWVRNGEWMRGFALGCFFLLAGFIWEIWKIDAPVGSRVSLEIGMGIVMVFALFVAWHRHS